SFSFSSFSLSCRALLIAPLFPYTTLFRSDEDLLKFYAFLFCTSYLYHKRNILTSLLIVVFSSISKRFISFCLQFLCFYDGIEYILIILMFLLLIFFYLL